MLSTMPMAIERVHWCGGSEWLPSRIINGGTTTSTRKNVVDTASTPALPTTTHAATTAAGGGAAAAAAGGGGVSALPLFIADKVIWYHPFNFKEILLHNRILPFNLLQPILNFALTAWQEQARRGHPNQRLHQQQQQAWSQHSVQKQTMLYTFTPQHNLTLYKGGGGASSEAPPRRSGGYGEYGEYGEYGNNGGTGERPLEALTEHNTNKKHVGVIQMIPNQFCEVVIQIDPTQLEKVTFNFGGSELVSFEIIVVEEEHGEGGSSSSSSGSGGSGGESKIGGVSETALSSSVVAGISKNLAAQYRQIRLPATSLNLRVLTRSAKDVRNGKGTISIVQHFKHRGLLFLRWISKKEKQQQQQQPPPQHSLSYEIAIVRQSQSHSC